VIAEARRHEAMREVADRLVEARSILDGMDAAGPGVDLGRYGALARCLEPLPARVEPGRLVQVDLVKPAAQASLDDDLIGEIRQGVEILRGVMGTGRDDLTRFRQAFTARYEAREIPLVVALDEEAGIGFGRDGRESAQPEPLLDGVIPQSPPPSNAYHGDDENVRRVLMAKLLEAHASGAIEIVLEKQDLQVLARSVAKPLPVSYGVVASVAAASESALDRGDFLVYLAGVCGPSGVRWFGRFCHADPDLRERVGAYIRAEEAGAPEAIFAEVVHVPEDRLGNVVFRPLLRDYEIPFLGRSGASPDKQIPVSDLVVSVVGERVVPALPASRTRGHPAADERAQLPPSQSSSLSFPVHAAVSRSGRGGRVVLGLARDRSLPPARPLRKGRPEPRALDRVLEELKGLANEDDADGCGACAGGARRGSFHGSSCSATETTSCSSISRTS
jgi:hypothetical protein